MLVVPTVSVRVKAEGRTPSHLLLLSPVDAWGLVSLFHVGVCTGHGSEHVKMCAWVILLAPLGDF